MKQNLLDKKRNLILAHAAIVVAVLAVSEPFDRTDISLWVMILGFGLLLIYYGVFHVAKLRYIPSFHVIVAVLHALLWVAAMCTALDWTRLTNWNRLIYVVYPWVAGIFLVCLLVLNLIMFIVKRLRKTHA